MRINSFLICTLIIFVFSTPIFAFEGNEKSEIDILKNILSTSHDFNELLSHKANNKSVKADGAVGRNKKKFTEVSTQRDSLWLLRRAIIEGDRNKVEYVIRAMEYAFKYQEKAGNFKNSLGIKRKRASSADSFFLQAYGNIYLLIEASDFRAEFLPRLKRLTPKLKKALKWLDKNKHNLYKMDKKAPNRLAFNGLAFLLNGYILGNNSYVETGERFFSEVMKMQAKEGIFLEKGGYDSSYQAVVNYNLTRALFYLQNEKLKLKISKSLKLGTEWELSRIEDSGRVKAEGNKRTGLKQEKFLGKFKDINYPEVALSLYYWGAVHNDNKVLNIADKVVGYAVRHYKSNR